MKFGRNIQNTLEFLCFSFHTGLLGITLSLGSEENRGKNAKNRGKQLKKMKKNRGKFAAKLRHQIS